MSIETGIELFKGIGCGEDCDASENGTFEKRYQYWYKDGLLEIM